MGGAEGGGGDVGGGDGAGVPSGGPEQKSLGRPQELGSRFLDPWT